jgi:hypothetical protein
MSDIADNLIRVQREIQRCAENAGRNAEDIRLIAVSKTRSLAEVKSVFELGQNIFGENTIQDAMTKIPHLQQNVEW